jgi:hypothetical protein
MTRSNDQPNDRRIDRQLRTIARRVNRLEDTQVTWGELNVEFDRLYDEVDELKAEMNQRFTVLETEMNRRFDSQDVKFDIIILDILPTAEAGGFQSRKTMIIVNLTGGLTLHRKPLF